RGIDTGRGELRNARLLREAACRVVEDNGACSSAALTDRPLGLGPPWRARCSAQLHRILNPDRKLQMPEKYPGVAGRSRRTLIRTRRDLQQEADEHDQGCDPVACNEGLRPSRKKV